MSPFCLRSEELLNWAWPTEVNMEIVLNSRQHKQSYSIKEIPNAEDEALAFRNRRSGSEPVDYSWSVFKTIKLGTGLNTVSDFWKSLIDKGFRIDTWARDILCAPSFGSVAQPTDVDLVIVSIGDIGFKRGATTVNVYKRVQERGLKLCPAEVGPQLRLQYSDQPMGEWLRIGMDPVIAPDGSLRVFGVGHGDFGCWLGGDCCSIVGAWDAISNWVFVRPHKHLKN